MPRLRRRLTVFVRAHVGDRVCRLAGHGIPVLAEVEVRVRDRVPPTATETLTRAPRTEFGVVCRRCGARVGD